MVRVAVVQFAPGEDKQANLRTATTLVGRAVDQGARVVVLPEYAMFTAPRPDRRFVDSAEPLDGEFVTGLRALAKRSEAFLVAGVNEALASPAAPIVSGDGAEEARFRNTLIAVGPDGDTVALYRKLHLYDAFGFTESDVVQAGEITAPETFSVGSLTLGLQTCYDLRFPEVTRRIVDAGADALLLGAAWVPGPLKEDHWRTLLRARAIENTMYIAAAGQNAPTGAGNSMIVDPMGVVVASLGETTDVVVAEISVDRISEVRAKNPALALRRFTVTPRH